MPILRESIPIDPVRSTPEYGEKHTQEAHTLIQGLEKLVELCAGTARAKYHLKVSGRAQRIVDVVDIGGGVCGTRGKDTNSRYIIKQIC